MERKEMLELIDYIEDKDIKINKDWYYHFSPFNKEVYKSIFKDGLLCAYLRGEEGPGYNGKYYICATKDTGDSDRIYNRLITKMLMFVIDSNVVAFKTKKDTPFRYRFIDTRLPIRCASSYEEEYHIYKRVFIKDIIAVHYYLNYLVERGININKYIEEIKELSSVILESNLNLSIYDFSTKREINKEKVLKL